MPYIGKTPQGEFKKLDGITTNGNQTYAMTYGSSAFEPGQAEKMLVSVNGVIQEPGVGFTVSGSNITFGAALAAADVVDFIVVMGEVGNVQTVTDNSIGATKMASDMVADHTPIRVNNNSVDTNVTITSTKNAMAAGPLTLNATLTINGTMTVV
mgnify:CR=1 FL=1